MLRPHPLSRTCRDPELSELLKEVDSKAIAFRKKAYARKLKFKQSMLPRRRSFGNLSELRESEEDEMHRQARLQQLKYPSEFKLNAACYEVEGSADLLMRAINDLIKTGKSASRCVNHFVLYQNGNCQCLKIFEKCKSGMRRSVWY